MLETSICHVLFLLSAVGLSLTVDIQLGDGVNLLPTTRPERLLPEKRYEYYETVSINDPSATSAGMYFRISQRGVDYLANLTCDALPQILHRLVLPSISESGLSLTNAVITKMERPDMSVKFVEAKGVVLEVRLSELQIRGSAELAVLFSSYKAQLLAVLTNLTVHMELFIGRNLNAEKTNVTVTKCDVQPGTLNIQYFGQEATDFYTVGNMIESGIQEGVRDKICMLPPLVRDFVREKVAEIMEPPTTQPPGLSAESSFYAEDLSVVDHLCSDIGQEDTEPTTPAEATKEEDSPDVRLPEEGGSWVPDLTLRYPPAFSRKDLVFGIDGGVLLDGVSAPPTIERPKFANVTVMRDQMAGLIVSEYVLNTLFYHIYDKGMGSISVTYGHKHIPKVFRSIAKLACSDCKLVVKANLTSPPISAIGRNGIVLHLEGDISINFFRKNQTSNLLTASGLIRVMLKPHFRHSRLFSDMALAGVDFKVYRSGMSGFMAGAVRKIISFLIPRAIWPKIQQRLRLAVNYKGLRIPRFCAIELQRLHMDYVNHAAVISGDFNVDLPLVIHSFKQFMENKLRHTRTKAELEDSFRYLKR